MHIVCDLFIYTSRNFNHKNLLIQVGRQTGRLTCLWRLLEDSMSIWLLKPDNNMTVTGNNQTKPIATCFHAEAYKLTWNHLRRIYLEID